MVNKPDSVPPKQPNQLPDPAAADIAKVKAVPHGFSVSKPQTFLNMTFTPEEWNKLMDIMLKNLSDYMNKTMQKMTAKLKKDWKRGQGDDVED